MISNRRSSASGSVGGDDDPSALAPEGWPVSLVSFQRAATFKDALVLFAPLLIFILPPFHTIVRLQRELAVGAHERVRAVLTHQPDAVWPPGMIYIPPSWLGLLFLALGVMKVVGGNHMLDALAPGPYAQLFTIMSYVSTAIWLTIVLGSLGWYAVNLNELRREIRAAYKLTAAPDSRRT